MTDKTTMSFTLNQAALNAAIGAELPRFLRELDFDYTSGREPKGLTAQVTVPEAMIRQAVTAYARKNVAANFNHFGITFKATRGEDGIVATVVASNAPIEEEAPSEPAKAAPRSAPVETKTAEEPTPSTEQAEADAIATAEAVVSEDEAKGVADIAQDTGAAAPMDTEQSEDAPVDAPADAPAEAAAVEKADGATEAPAPARSKLFAGLKRPDNSATTAE